LDEDPVATPLLQYEGQGPGEELLQDILDGLALLLRMVHHVDVVLTII